MPAEKAAKKKANAIPLPPAGDWRTTDQDEIVRRIQRARDEKHSIANLHPEHSVFSTFAVKSPSGMTYQVEIRDLKERNGGAIAVGHPFGMTGARITTTLINSLQFHDKQFGLETMCVGGGQGMAMVIERLS